MCVGDEYSCSCLRSISMQCVHFSFRVPCQLWRTRLNTVLKGEKNTHNPIVQACSWLGIQIILIISVLLLSCTSVRNQCNVPKVILNLGLTCLFSAGGGSGAIFLFVPHSWNPLWMGHLLLKTYSTLDTRTGRNARITTKLIKNFFNNNTVPQK